MALLDHNPKWQISGTKLKMPIEDLGAHWFAELLNSAEALGKSVKA
jgi:hypothetical protein